VKAAAKYSKKHGESGKAAEMAKAKWLMLKSISMAAMKISMAAKAYQRKWRSWRRNMAAAASG
jgi:hypothetical protein